MSSNSIIAVRDASAAAVATPPEPADQRKTKTDNRHLPQYALASRLPIYAIQGVPPKPVRAG
jgi:hypothetical protein